MARTFDRSFIDGFYEFHRDHFGHRASVVDVAETSINAAGGAAAIDYNKVAEKFRMARTSLRSLYGYTSRIVPAYQLVEMFRDSAAGAPSGRLLDIGCGRGIHMRLLKAWGLIDEAVGIDIYDHCSGFDENSLKRLSLKFRCLRPFEAWQDRIARKPRKEWSSIENSVMRKIPTARRFAEDYGHRPDKGIYSLSFKRNPKVDRFIAGNVFELDEKFDVVTSFASMDWFSADEFLAKVGSLLNEGGYFYVWVANWWHSINTTNIFGHAPFSAQRMSREELEAYARNKQPAYADDIMKSYAYFDSAHPTLADLVDLGARHGLVPVTWRQNVLPNAVRHRGGISSLGVAKHDNPAFESAYSDSAEISPKLRRLDMYPFSNAVLFQKISRNARLDSATFEQLEQQLKPRNSDGPVMKTVRKVGGWVFR